jgi:hypothetical protein
LPFPLLSQIKTKFKPNKKPIFKDVLEFILSETKGVPGYNEAKDLSAKNDFTPLHGLV